MDMERQELLDTVDDLRRENERLRTANNAAVELQDLRRRLMPMFDQLGRRQRCQGLNCGATLWMVQLADGKMAPYSLSGLNHYADCKDPDHFKDVVYDVEPRHKRWRNLLPGPVEFAEALDHLAVAGKCSRHHAVNLHHLYLTVTGRLNDSTH